MTKPANPSTEAPACKPWCGTETESGTGPCWIDARNYYCTSACRDAGRPLRPTPQPIERCSCAESMRLRTALERLLADVESANKWQRGETETKPGLYDCRQDELQYIERIARRALALEPEE